MFGSLRRYKSHDLESPEVRANPHELYHRIRRKSPIFQKKKTKRVREKWYFTRYQDCVDAIKEPRFVKNLDGVRGNPKPGVIGPTSLRGSMIRQDPPDHTRLRSLVQQAFTPKAIRRIETQIQDIADACLDEMEGQDEVDLMQALAFPLPITVIADMLGVPRDKHDLFRKWTQATLFIDKSPDNIDCGRTFAGYLDELIQERRGNLGDDILSGLIQASENGSVLNDEELASTVNLLLAAGHETTSSLIGNGMLALLQHPDQLELLKADPSLMASAVEEMLRYDSPIDSAPPRFAGEDMTWKGHRIRKGAVIHPLLAAANRDPDIFENPDAFDIRRSPNRHIAFGAGIHFCLGAHLARIEAANSIGRLLARFPDIQLNADPKQLPWSTTMMVHGVRSLPVKLR